MRVLKMDPESDEKARGVLTEILGSSQHAETVRQIEDLLGIDRDFPAAVNLVERVLAVLSSIPAKSTLVNDWVGALASVQEAGADSTPFGHPVQAYPDSRSTLIRTGSRSAATQGWHS